MNKKYAYMTETVGIFVGSKSSFNVVLAASHIGQCLSVEFTIHLISTHENVAEDTSDIYDRVYGSTKNNSILGEIKALRGYLSEFSPDVLFQITSPPLHGTIVSTMGAYHNVPTVYRYSGDRFNVYRLSKGVSKPIHYITNNILGKIPLKQADHFITMGPYGKTQLQKQGINEDSISMIPPSVDMERINTDSAVSLSTGRRVALFVGRISRRKGIKTLEDTIPRIIDKNQDIKFVFVGEQIENIDVAEQYRTHITIVGPVSPDKIPSYLNRADVLIHPSLIEGLPRTVLEALATDTPPIARDVGDIPYATKNTFTSDSEFVEMVCGSNRLTADPVDPFLIENVQEDYIEVVNRLIK